jgi:hypothetical protein
LALRRRPPDCGRGSASIVTTQPRKEIDSVPDFFR